MRDSREHGLVEGFEIAPTDVAIIGMAGRFPGARNVEEFWQNLLDGVESISFLSDQEVLSSGIDAATLRRPDYVQSEFVLEDTELFDASFFGITSREAEIIDPQHRLFLECAWEALESTGYDPETCEGLIGIYAGVGMNSYLLNNLYPSRGLVEVVSSPEIKLANDKDHLTTRVAYKLNLRGPSITVQTTCSTSLVATYLACQSLLSYQCDMTLAGGVTIKVPQKTGTLALKGAASPDGHCRAFDARAQGTAGGAGVGIVVLKRLMDALEDGDYIYAVIKGLAINNDGSSKVGYPAPSVKGQARVIAMAQAIAGVDAETISYIEAHGTGTSLGDPVEIAALTQAFRASTQKKGFCAIGSVKTNIGHTDTAAGAVGLIKTALALKHKVIPPSLNFEQPNPEIDFANSPFYVNTTLSEWKAGSTPRRAGVSAFGLGGANAHVILEEAPAVEPSETSRPWQLLVLSAKTDTALETATANLAEHLKRHPDLNLADVAYTLQVGRRAFDYRRMLVCQGREDAVAALEMLNRGQVFTGLVESRNRPVVFMFPGIGPLYVNMGAELYQTEPVFREQVDHCSEFLEAHLGLDLRNVLYPPVDSEQEASVQLERGSVGLLALFVTSYALAKLWVSWGVHPQAMIGHSLGEYVAACLAGVFSLEDALRLVVLRGQLFDQLPEGAMVTVLLSEKEVRPFLSETLSLATVNGPSRCVVSGPTTAISELEELFMKHRVEFHRMHVSRAAHSGMVEPILDAFAEALGKLSLRAPSIPYVSNVTGTWITAAEATDPGHWTRHLRQTVRFWDGIQEILSEPSRVLVEVGPGRTLSALVKLHLGSVAQRPVFSSMRLPREPRSDVEILLNTLGRLWLTGVRIDWSGFYVQERRYRVPLPTYPFERQRYWVEPSQKQMYSLSTRQPELDRKPDIADWFYAPSWKRSTLQNSYRQGSLADQKARWLLLVDELGLGSGIAKRLAQDEQDVTTVIAGDRFERINDRMFTINPRERGDYSALLDELEVLDKFPERIIHLWSVTPDKHPLSEVDSFEQTQHTGFYSLLFLAQSIGIRGVTDPLEVWIVSSNMHEVIGEETLCPAKATILGLCEVIPHEYPNVTCHSVDVVAPESRAGQAEKLIDQIMTEISAEMSDSVVAYRGDHRWVPILEAMRMGDETGCKAQLREEGVYLITGGLGSVGYGFAEYLAQTVQPKLVLIEPSGLPERDEWEQWLSSYDGHDDPSHGVDGTKIKGGLHVEMEKEQDYINRLEDEIERDIGIEGLPEELEETLNELCSSYIYDYLRTSNVGTEKGKTCHIEGLKKTLRILPKFDKFYDFFIRVLAEDKILRVDGDRIEFLKNPEEVKKPTALRAALEKRYPEHVEAVQFLEYCVGHYDRALTGEMEAISVLLPDGSFDTLKPFVEEGMKFSRVRIYIRLIAELISNRIAEAQDKKLRILEVGAGSGELAWAMAPDLGDQDVEYHFTDIGKMFVINAERRALQGGLGFMKFGVLDISKDPAEQGCEKYSFDVILAYNVVHATESIEKTIRNLKKLLVPNGIMLILEVTKTRRWTTMIDGLAEGWWYFADEDIRKVSPLLSPQEWENVLRKQGFRSVRVYPQDEEKRAETDYALIVVQQPSEIRTDDYLNWVSEIRRKEKQLVQDAVRKVKALEDLGAEVLVTRADVANGEQVQAAINQTCECLGGIHGVIHATEPRGTREARAFVGVSRADCEWYFQPKVHGVFALERALQGKQLDFGLLIHSSSPSWEGSEGVADSAANLFLDAYASNSKAHKRHWMSVNWDVRQSGEEKAQNRAAEPAIMPEEGREAFQRLLSMDAATQVVVSPRYLQAWADLWSKPGSVADAERSEKVDSLYSRPGLQSAYVAPSNGVEQMIAEIWEEVFGIAQIGLHDNFYELGGESLMATRIVSRIRDTFQVDLAIRSLLENPTVAGISRAIEEAQSSSVERQEPVIMSVSREAYRAKRSPEGEIEIPEIVRSQEDKLRRR